jgi:hypothetical protein
MFNYIILFMNVISVICYNYNYNYNYTVDDNSLDLNDLVINITDVAPKLFIDLVINLVID